jgi:predicted NAD/FAD-binding protein
VRVAIVGTGVSGLVVAHMLYGEHDISLFEANDYVGGHVNTFPVVLTSGRWAVDTGFIVYNERNYPNFSRLLAQLGVATQPSTMSFSVRCDRTGLEYNGSTLRQLFAQKRNLLRPSFYRMLREIVRFNKEALATTKERYKTGTLGEYLEAGHYSDEFVQQYLVPMGSAIWSIPSNRVLAMPADFFIRFFDNHGMLTINERPEWRVICGGSRRYVDVLTAPFADRIRLHSPVKQVLRYDDRVEVDGETFDHVVFACHSDQALTTLGDASEAERDILGAMPYQENRVVLHTDTTVLPRHRKAWGAWNYHIQDLPKSPVTVTYNMNILQSLEAPSTFCVSLNAGDSISPDRVLYRVHYKHPVYTVEGTEAQQRHGEISGVARTHFCGAYWGNGFHEDGVNSALAVGRAFGVSL